MDHLVKVFDFNNNILGVIIRRDYSINGIEFFSDPSDSQQIGLMNRPKGYKIQPHCHNLITREINLTQEVLFIKNGKVRVDFYSSDQNYIKSSILYSGDVVLLSNGGHGFEILEESTIFEVKQGPYSEEIDKVRFNSVNENKIIYF